MRCRLVEKKKIEKREEKGIQSYWKMKIWLKRNWCDKWSEVENDEGLLLAWVVGRSEGRTDDWTDDWRDGRLQFFIEMRSRHWSWRIERIMRLPPFPPKQVRRFYRRQTFPCAAVINCSLGWRQSALTEVKANRSYIKAGFKGRQTAWTESLLGKTRSLQKMS